MSKQSSRREVVFLDTNTLHYLSLFVRYTCNNGFTEKDIDNGEVLRRICQEEKAGEYRKHLKKGHNIISFVRHKDAQIEYSHVSIVELLGGRIRGAVTVRLAKEGAPERMLSRIKEEEIRELSELSHPGIMKGVNDLTSILDKWGIIFAARESRGSIDVLKLAMDIVGLVYMSAVDSIVYAEAIAARADYFVTEDDYLYQTVNLIHNPSERDRYWIIKEKLQRFVDDDQLPLARKCSGL